MGLRCAFVSAPVVRCGGGEEGSEKGFRGLVQAATPANQSFIVPAIRVDHDAGEELRRQ